MKPLLLSPDDTILLIVDIQENLWKVMHNKEEIEKNSVVLADLAKRVGIPIVVTEQYKKGIGPTIPYLAERIEGLEAMQKMSFNCFGLAGFQDRVASFNRKTILVAGIEAHICVMQTALAALGHGYTVHVVADATGSRTGANHRTGLERMRDAGCVITSAESAVFEVIKEAGTPLFKEMLRFIK